MLAVIVAVPATFPSTTPPLVTVAIVVFELVQVTVEPEGVGVAVKVLVFPTVTLSVCLLSTTP